MLRIQLQHPLGLDLVPAAGNGGEVFFHLQGDLPLGAQAGGSGLQLAGEGHVLHRAFQRFFGKGEHGLVGLLQLLQLLLILSGLQVRVPGDDVLQGFFLILPDHVHHKFVHLIREVEDAPALFPHGLRLGQLLQPGDGVPAGVIDALLLLRHGGDVAFQGDGLLRSGIVEQEQILQQLPLGAEVRQDSVFQLEAELGIELFVFLRLLLQELRQLALHLLLQVGGNDLQLPVVLQQFPGNIQAQIGAVHNAPDEAEAFRQQVRAVLHDHDAVGVQLQPGFIIPGIIVEGGLGRDEEQGLVAHGAFRAHPDDPPGLLRIVELFLIEGGAVLIRGLLLRALPQGHHAVHRVLPQLDGVAHIVGILFDELPELPVLQKFGVLLLLPVLLQTEDDLRALAFLLRGDDGVPVRSGALPPECGVGAELFRGDGDLVRHHEGAVKAHAELADDVDVLLPGLFLVHVRLELPGPGTGDDPQVGVQLLLVHADAVVRNGQGAGFLIRGDADEEIAPVQPRAAVLQGAVAELVDGIAGVADELPEENFPMGVDGMDHEIQQPFGFCLELTFRHSLSLRFNPVL